ncbi:MAG: hypothetical protein Q9217_000247 [Psora testacea]
MCGILALLHTQAEGTSVAAELHEALYLLQHRGQDACGISTCAAGGKIFQCKGNGLAAKVFRDGARVPDLPGYMGLGHLRYPTAGTSANAEAQPFFVNSPYGICFAHNGNLINALELKDFLDREAHRHINTDSDSELMLNVFANELNVTGKARVNCDDIFAALGRVGIIGFRDPYGIRPLVLGSRLSASGEGRDYMMASESVALQQLGFKKSNMQDILPGEAVIVQKGCAPVITHVQPQKRYCPDIFEYNDPDMRAAWDMGYKLAARIVKILTPAQLEDIDVVMPIPETSNTTAPCVATRLNKPYRQGFVKNRYVFRTFIMPGQKARQKGVRRKLNAMEEQFAGKNVLLVDDSIVRGTTSREIVLMAIEAGAKKVYFASAAPRIRHPHIYGIDLASPSELIAHNRTVEEIAKHIGAEKVIFQELEDLVDACRQAAPSSHVARETQEFEVGVFNGSYVTPVPAGYFVHLEKVRGENKKMKVIENAREAVVNGSAGTEELQIATHGAEVDSDGKVVPSGVCDVDGALVSGHSTPTASKRKRPADAGEPLPKRRQDIAIHNQHDFEDEE